jgi:hypothetical protein
MTQTQDNIFCSGFLDKLDAWVAGEFEAEHMWAHHDSCESCRMETRLAREIGAITTALPELRGPEIRVHHAKDLRGGRTLIERLLGAWREPLVLVPAFALLLAALVVIQLREPATIAVDPDIVIIDGTQYTREEIRKAAADLELALRYIDRYGTYPAAVISAELDESHLPLPEPQAQSEAPPTI